ncbi:MAG TPA: L,D-transpeptidase [Longimicrobiaceae bacterium]|nr:L,D-transpeptidase [Longimicrobiaceae bacterium]
MLSAAAVLLLTGLAAPCAAPAPRTLPPPGTPSLSLTLNLPAFRLEVRDGGRLVRTYRVAPGSRRYRTPIGRFRVFSVELNPWWHPPKSWWARKEKVTPPGPDNPMGRAKLNFGELYFLHGTPHDGSIGSAASHGCVRMHNGEAVELARAVLADVRPDVPRAEIDATLAGYARTRRYEFEPGVPLEIQYVTAEVHDGALELHPDVYGRERTRLKVRALAALAAAGVDTLAVYRPRLDSAVRAARRRHVRVPLPDLLRSPPPPDSADVLVLRVEGSGAWPRGPMADPASSPRRRPPSPDTSTVAARHLAVRAGVHARAS